MFITHKDYNPKNIRYAFFTKKAPTYKETRKQDLCNIAKIFKSEAITIVNQKHTNDVIFVKNYKNCPIADGQITTKSGIALGVLTADCVPILLADDENKIIGTIHAGWRGARSNIIQIGIKKMYALGAKKITAIIGPCIKQKNYEFSNDLYQDFISESLEYEKFFIPSTKENHHMFDLPGYVKLKLHQANVNFILDTERNTYEEEENFFSYRRFTHNPKSEMGNMVSVIMLK